MSASFVTQQIDYIESEVYKRIKPLGFRKHGRTLHRFVSGDISQVISFQCGQAYLDATHLMWVNIGIRIPECTERRFDAVNIRKYYHEYHKVSISDFSKSESPSKSFRLTILIPLLAAY